MSTDKAQKQILCTHEMGTVEDARYGAHTASSTSLERWYGKYIASFILFIEIEENIHTYAQDVFGADWREYVRAA